MSEHEPWSSTVAWAVDATRAELPPDVAAMVAPSITVSAGPAGTGAAVDAAAPAAGPRVELLLYRAKRPAAAPTSASALGGRHRRAARAG
jgi:hypothetical protein